MDDTKTSGRNPDPYGVWSNGANLKYENDCCGDLDVTVDGFPGIRSHEPSLNNSIAISNSSVWHENISGKCLNVPENSNDDGDLFRSVNNSILTDVDPVQSHEISDHHMNPDNVLEDLDVYLDDLNACLTVSRLVSDAVIKDTVATIIEEANERITTKDMQILAMKEEPCQYKLAGTSSEIGSSVKNDSKGDGQSKVLCPTDSHVEQICVEFWDGLKIATVDQLQTLKKSIEHLIHTSLMDVNSFCFSGGAPLCSVSYEGQMPNNLKNFDKASDTYTMFIEAVHDQVNDIFCLFENSISEHKWTYNIQNEFMAIATKDYVASLEDEFERRLCEERKMLSNNLSTVFDDVKNLRNELDNISRSLLCFELGHLGFQSGHQNLDYRNMIRVKDSSLIAPSHDSTKGMIETADSPQLLCMSKEELISYYRAEINKMKRHHESALQEKTEELFTVKRELLKEKGLIPFRKDRDYDMLKKSIMGVIAKLDTILLDSEKYMSEGDYEKSTTEKGNSCDLLWECPSSRDSLSDIKDINECLLRRETEKMLFPSEDLLQMDDTNWDIQDVKIDSELRDSVHKVFLRCWINETKNHFEFVDMEVRTIHEIYSAMLTGAVEESKSMIDAMKTKYDDMNNLLLESCVHREETVLRSEVERTEKLMCELQSLSKLVEVKDEYIKEVECALSQQKELYEEACHELSLLKDQQCKQAELLLDNSNELESVKNQLEKAIFEIRQNEEKIAKFDKDLLVALDGLDGAEKEKAMLCNIIKGKEDQILAMNVEERILREKIRTLIFYVLEGSKSFEALEDNLSEKIQRQTARLDSMKYQMSQLMQKVALLQGKISDYEHKLDVNSSNLRKAETEVDLLADEVDALLNLLAKMYITLEHYSPVFQHYPGVMEILKLIKREVKGV